MRSAHLLPFLLIILSHDALHIPFVVITTASSIVLFYKNKVRPATMSPHFNKLFLLDVAVESDCSTFESVPA